MLCGAVLPAFEAAHGYRVFMWILFTCLSVDSFGPNVRETLRMKLPTVLKLCLCLFCHTLWPLSGPVI